MPDPVTLTLVGTVVLKEGVKFLYSQAGELIKRWHDRRDAAAADTSKQIETPLKADPSIFNGTVAPLVADADRLQSLEPQLRQLRAALADYADGIEPVDVQNSNLVDIADILRQQLETIYGQRLTFTGEPRQPSGTPLVIGTAEVKSVAGLAAGVIAGTITVGEIRGSIKAERVESGGTAAAVKVDKIGS